MSLQVALNAAGGLALFLLAMLMMTEGLKVFAGGHLRQLLAQWTSTPVRGVFSGMLVPRYAKERIAYCCRLRTPNNQGECA